MGGGGSEIESYDPVWKKPKLLSDKDPDQDPSDDHGLMSEDESDNEFSDEFDSSTHNPIGYQLSEKWIEKNSKSDLKLDQIRRKIADLRSMGFKGISFTALHISEAYRCLKILSDPVDSNLVEHLISSKQRGFEIAYDFVEHHRDPAYDASYLEMLKKIGEKKIGECGVVLVDDVENRINWRVVELRKDSDLYADDELECYEDYCNIYVYPELVKKWRDIRAFLLDSKSKVEYCRDPKKFEETLKKNHRFVFRRRLDYVFEAFFKWWTNDTEEDGVRARTLIDEKCKEALEKNDYRLKRVWTAADYVRLKLDVASCVGIFEIPDEITGFVLPGHYKWSTSTGTFDPVPYDMLPQW